MKQLELVKSDGSVATGNMVPTGVNWYFNFLSRASQVANKSEELIVPEEIVMADEETVVVLIDSILQYIEQSDMFNDNELGVDGGYRIMDAVLTSVYSPTDIGDKLKFKKTLSSNLIDTSEWVIEVVDGALPVGLELKFIDGDYIIEGNVTYTDAKDYLSGVDIDEQSGYDYELTKWKYRRVHFINVDYVDGLDSNVIISDPVDTISVGDVVHFPVSGDSREIIELDAENNFYVNEFVGDGEGGSLQYEYGRWVTNEDYTSIDPTWNGYLTIPAKNIFLRYSRLRHKFPGELVDEHSSGSTFTLGIRKKTGSSYYDLQTFNINIRSNMDSTRDNQSVVQEGDETKLLSSADYSDDGYNDTEVYWSGNTFKDPLDHVIKFRKDNGSSTDIQITDEKLIFNSSDPENELITTNEELSFFKAVDGIKRRDIIDIRKFK